MRIALLLTGMIFQTASLACGYCVEDKIAATYDHAVVTAALAAKHHVVFFHVDGAAAPRKLLAAADAAGGDRGTARVSPDGLTLSLAFDPRRVTLPALQSGVEKRAAGVSLLPMRLMDRPADLKAVSLGK